MAYFSNGTEGMDWETTNCGLCIHNSEDEGCPIWAVHQLFNYDQCNKGKTGKAIKEILETLIPTQDGGLFAGPCPMLIHKDAVTTDEEKYLRRLQGLA